MANIVKALIKLSALASLLIFINEISYQNGYKAAKNECNHRKLHCYSDLEAEGNAIEPITHKNVHKANIQH